MKNEIPPKPSVNTAIVMHFKIKKVITVDVGKAPPVSFGFPGWINSKEDSKYSTCIELLGNLWLMSQMLHLCFVPSTVYGYV